MPKPLHQCGLVLSLLTVPIKNVKITLKIAIFSTFVQ